MRTTHVIAAAAAILAAPGAAHAQAVSFSKDIVPMLREQCVKCHGAKAPQAGFSVISFAAIDKGGRGGKVLAPKAADSRLIKYLEGTLKPQMPIGAPMKKEQIARFKAWVDQGSKTDVPADTIVINETTIPAVKIPKIALRVPVLPQAAALAWSKDNKILALGTYQVVRLVDPSNGSTIRELKGHTDVVHDLRFSPDATKLAAAGGPPAQQGEIKIWEVATGKLLQTITGHTDFIYSCSWSPDNKNIASASYDKSIKIWDVEKATEIKTLKDHADAVYAVAYNPAGNLLASGSADRSVKVWDVAAGKRLYTLSGHGDIVFSLSWNAAGNQITSTGADRTVRTWNVNPQNGNQARNVTGHEKSVNEVCYSPDGSLMATASDDKSVVIWNAGNGSKKHTLGSQPDSMLSVAFSGDNKQLAVGSFDGTVRIYNVEDGKLVSTVIDLPKAPEPKPTAKVEPVKVEQAKPALVK